jgi:hypothetical protein
MPALPQSRGPISELVIGRLNGPVGETPLQAPPPAGDPLGDDDLQLALYCLYELHYAGFDGADPAWEWEPALLALRRELERRFEEALVEAAGPPVGADPESVPAALFELAAEDGGRSLSHHLKDVGDAAQFREFVVHRSAYQLKEADPHTWAIPRLRGKAKAAMVEVQADEYGGGRPERVHSTLFAKSMDALGLDSSYGAYLDLLPGATLATVNLISMLGLHRRWRGALAGHLATFEISSPLPNGRYAAGLRRLGYGADALDFFEEHVVADSVHENVAAYDLAGSLAADEPELAGDILFGARALLHLDARWADRVLAAWAGGESSLLRPLAEAAPAGDFELAGSRNGHGPQAATSA